MRVHGWIANKFLPSGEHPQDGQAVLEIPAKNIENDKLCTKK
jgi:hypothetical protein